MKNNFTKLVSAALLLFVAAMLFPSSSVSPKIKGKIKGMGNDTLLVFYYPLNADEDYNEMEHMDTVIVKKGKFSFVPNMKLLPAIVNIYPKSLMWIRPDGHPLIMDGRNIELYMSHNSPVTISGEVGDAWLRYSVKGSDFNEEYARLNMQMLDINISQNTNEMQLERQMALRNTPENDEKIDSLFGVRRAHLRQKHVIRRDYITANPANQLAGVMFLHGIGLDSTEVYYNKLSDDVRNGIFKDNIQRNYYRYLDYMRVQENKSRIVEGKSAPGFTLKGLDGKDVALSDMAGKYVVLDFWGSWCGPCVAGIPKMKAYYEKYRGKVEFIGLAAESEGSWREAADKYRLPWISLLDDKKVNVAYSIDAYPTKIILSPDHTILNIFVGEEEDFYAALDQLFR